MEPELKLVRHKIGSTRTIQTAVLVTEYLRQRCSVECSIHPDAISYVFTDATDKNGFWTADIIVTSHALTEPSMEACSILVNTCRAFVAGRGEIWT